MAGGDRHLLHLPGGHGHQRPSHDRALPRRVPGAGAGAAAAFRLLPRARRLQPRRSGGRRRAARPAGGRLDGVHPGARRAAVRDAAAAALALHCRPRQQHRAGAGGRRLLRRRDARLDRPDPHQPGGGDAGAVRARQRAAGSRSGDALQGRQLRPLPGKALAAHVGARRGDSPAGRPLRARRG